MTKKDVEKHWEQIMAFKDGKIIQCKNLENGVWYDTNEPSFYINCEYRIKPEEKLIPFKFFKFLSYIFQSVTI